MTSLVSSRRVGCQGRSLLGPELVVVVLGMAEKTRRQRLITRHDGYNQEVKKRMVVDSKIFLNVSKYQMSCCQEVGQFSHPVDAEESRVVSVEITEAMTRDEVCTLIMDMCHTLYNFL